jgi:hypothetical protein
LEDARELGDDRLYTSAQLGAGTVAIRVNNLDEAKERLIDTLQTALSSGDSDIISFVLEAVGDLATRQRRFYEAARLFAAEDKQRERVGIPMTPTELPAREAQIQQIREAIGEAVFAIAWSEGEKLNEEEAVRYVYAEL